MSVSVTIGVHLPCIDQEVDFYIQGTLGRELLLQNYYNNATVTSKRRVVNTPQYNEYVHANITKTIRNDSYI